MNMKKNSTDPNNENATENKTGKKTEELLDNFPNQHFASALRFTQDPADETEKEREIREAREASIRKRQEEMARKQAEWDALPQEEKDRIEAERLARQRENDERRWKFFLDEIGDVTADEKTLEAINIIGDRLWREKTPKYQHSITYGRKSDDTRLSPNFLSSNIPPSLPSNGERHDEGMALALATRLEGIAIGRHERPIILWLYNNDSPYAKDCEDGGRRTYLLFSPDEIASAEKDGDAEFLEAFAYLCETYGIIYDERAGDGYDYEDMLITETVTGGDGQERDITHHVWRLADGMSMQDIVPEEVLFLAATLDVSFIVDRYSAFYHYRTPKCIRQQPDGTYDCEYDEEEGEPDNVEELQAPGSAYWRMYRNSGFEKLLAMTCLDDEDKEYLSAIMDNSNGRFRMAWSLAHPFMHMPDEFKSDALIRIEKMMQDAVVAWDYTSGNPDGMYELLDESPTDEQIYTEMLKWMEESGCRELVRRASAEGRDIWELMRERPNDKNIMWVAVSPEKAEELNELPVVVSLQRKE